MRYNFYVTDSKVICVSSYAGKAVRGIAKCDPKDNFDPEAGKKLSQLRCDCKIAGKRYRRAREKYSEALKLLDDAREYLVRMASYQEESFKEYEELRAQLEEFEKSL